MKLALLNGRDGIASYLRDVIGVVPFVLNDVFQAINKRRLSGPEGQDFRGFSDFHRLAWKGKFYVEDFEDHQRDDPFGRTTLQAL